MENPVLLCMIIIGCIGLVGNVLAIIAYTRKTTQKNFHLLMCCLAVNDLFVIIFWLVVSLADLVQLNASKYYQDFFLYLYPLGTIGLTGSIYFTLAITIERNMNLRNPFSKKTSVWITYILPITVFSILCNLSRFFELTVKEITTDLDYDYDWYNETDVGNKKYFMLEPTELRKDNYYTEYYLLYFTFIIQSLVPVILLITFSIAIYRKLSSINLSSQHSASSSQPQEKGEEGEAQRRELILTQTSLIIALIFLISHSFRIIPLVWQIVNELNKWNWTPYMVSITELSNVVILVSSSTKFYIYFIKQKWNNGMSTPSSNEATKMQDML